MRYISRLKLWILAIVCIFASCCMAPFAYASAPGPQPGQATPSSVAAHQPSQAFLDWLAKKKAHRVRSGIRAGQGKGAGTQPFIISSTNASTSYPAAMTLNLTNTVGVTEPSDGQADHLNDAAGHTYDDHDFFDLCGPGAADVTLWYWPYPPNDMSSTNITDTATSPLHVRYGVTAPSVAPVTTTWNSDRLRGYMTYLAWGVHWPNGPHTGMQDNSGYYTWGATLYNLKDVLNWEASGRNTSTWQYYFYTIVWNNNTPGSSPSSWVSPSVFQSDIMDDIYNSHVPVIAEVDASLLGPSSNWNGVHSVTHHFITIVGYDNTAGTYTYLDTCANSTGCNTSTNNYEGQPYKISQSSMWNAMAGVAMNQSTDPSGGDGGYIW